MKTALEILKETHQELSTPNPADWKSFDVIMSDGTGEAMLKAMERFAMQFEDDNGRANYYEDKIDTLNRNISENKNRFTELLHNLLRHNANYHGDSALRKMIETALLECGGKI